MWAGWHLKGAAGTLREWLAMPNFERVRICHHLDAMIKKNNESGRPPDDI